MPDGRLNSTTSSHAGNLSFLRHRDGKKDRIGIGLFFWEVRDEEKTLAEAIDNTNKDVVQIHHLLMESRKKSLACLPTLSTIVARRTTNIFTKRCNGADPLISPCLCIFLAGTNIQERKYLLENTELCERFLSAYLPFVPRYASGRGERN